MIERLKRLVARVTSIGADPADTDDIQLKKALLVLCAVPFAFAGLAWGLMYFSLGEPLAGLIPFSYGVFSLCSIAIFGLTREYRFFRFSQLILILLLPFLLMATLGGFVNGSTVILWAVICPLGALVFDEPRRAFVWLLAYLGLLVVSGLLQPHLRLANNLSVPATTFFFVINIVCVSAFIFTLVFYFVNQKEAFIELMRRNRELEQSYLEQEVMLRQGEKLATLGRLSAGMAHEMNNPASAAVRGSKQLRALILESEEVYLRLGGMSLSEQQLEVFESLESRVHAATQPPIGMDALIRSDREAALESWLESRAVGSAWEVASMLVSLDFEEGDLQSLDETFPGEQLPVVLASMRSTHASHRLLEEIWQATNRISEIVRALKSYSHMDQAPLQSVDVHDGIKDTLVMLRGQLKDGIAVRTNFDEDLPRIQAFGRELNQVWTNLIVNAIDAMKGQGTISIRTFREAKQLVVRVEDSGPGIPQGIQEILFDPFTTTKPPGEGTGLGLNIVHNIVVQKHAGRISAHSGEAGAVFEVRLPLNGSAERPEE